MAGAVVDDGAAVVEGAVVATEALYQSTTLETKRPAVERVRQQAVAGPT